MAATTLVRPQPRHARVPPPAPRPPRVAFGFRPELEGLRGIAVLAVVAYHAGVPFLPGGYVGVDVFFVLSGYLITGLMLAEVDRTGRLSLSRFWARRARRLLPASALVLTVTALASSVLLPLVQRQQNALDILSAGLYVSNWRFATEATDYLAADSAPSVVLHFWSLGIEEQFYVLWPLLIVAALFVLARVRRFGDVRRYLGVTIAAVAGVSLLAGAAVTSTNQPLAFFGTGTRVWELAAGALVAVVGRHVLAVPHVARAALAWSGFLLVGWAVLRLDDSTPYPGWAALVPVLGTALVIAGCTSNGRHTAPGPARTLSHRRLRRAGLVSYSWYLWHWPLLVLPAAALDHPLTRWQVVLAVAASYGLAELTYRTVESTLRYAPRLQPGKPSLVLAAGLTALAVLASVVLWHSGDDSEARTGVTTDTERVAGKTFVAAPGVSVDLGTGEVSRPAKLTPSIGEAAEDRFAELYDNGCQANLTGTQVTDCVMGKKKSNTTMVVFGDSHAAAWAPALDMLAVERHWRMVPMTKGGCGAALFSVWNPQLERAMPECDTWRAAALERIRELEPDLIVVANRWKYSAADANGNRMPSAQGSEVVAQGTRAMLDELRGTGAKIVFLRDIPGPGFDAPSCLSKHEGDFSACDFPRSEQVDQDESLLAAVRATPDVQVVDLVEQVCPASEATCPVAAENLLRYRDTNHMTATYARTLAPALLAEFPRKL